MMNLEDRIVRLEAELASLRKRNRTFGVLLMLAVAVPALLAFGRGQVQVVRAERFEVVKDGKVLAKLDESVFGGGSLSIYSEDGKEVGYLLATSTGGMLSILDKDGKPVGMLSTGTEGGSLGIFNKDGKHVGGLAATRSGGLLGVNNKDGRVVGALGADPEGGTMMLLTPDGEVRFKAP